MNYFIGFLYLWLILSFIHTLWTDYYFRQYHKLLDKKLKK